VRRRKRGLHRHVQRGNYGKNYRSPLFESFGDPALVDVSDEDCDRVEANEGHESERVDGADDTSEKQGQVRQREEDGGPERDRPDRG